MVSNSAMNTSVAEMSGRPSGTHIGLGIPSFASRRGGPLELADAPRIGPAGRTFGRVDLPNEIGALSNALRNLSQPSGRYRIHIVRARKSAWVRDFSRTRIMPMAGVEGLEPPTPGFGDRCSSQ